jgi:hypothetical protein
MRTQNSNDEGLLLLLWLLFVFHGQLIVSIDNTVVIVVVEKPQLSALSPCLVYATSNSRSRNNNNNNFNVLF